MSAASEGRDDNSAVQIGTIAFVLLDAPQAPEAKARWDCRAEALSNLLMALWRKERARRERGELPGQMP